MSNALKFTPDGGQIRVKVLNTTCSVLPGRRQGDPKNFWIVEDGNGDNEVTAAQRKQCLEISIIDSGI